MTAVNIIRHTSGISVLTDGAVQDDEGRLVYRTNKVFFFPHLNAVVAIAGKLMMSRRLANQIGTTETTFDELASCALEKAKAIEAFAKSEWEKEFGAGVTEFTLFVAGISETTGPASFVIASHDDYAPHIPAWTLVNLGKISLHPADESLFGKWKPRINSAEFDVQSAISLMNDQRAMTTPNRVGCFAQLTTIEKGCISSRVIHRWDEDILGERIDPRATEKIGPPFASSPSGDFSGLTISSAGIVNA